MVEVGWEEYVGACEHVVEDLVEDLAGQGAALFKSVVWNTVRTASRFAGKFDRQKNVFLFDRQFIGIVEGAFGVWEPDFFVNGVGVLLTDNLLPMLGDNLCDFVGVSNQDVAVNNVVQL